MPPPLVTLDGCTATKSVHSVSPTFPCAGVFQLPTGLYVAVTSAAMPLKAVCVSTRRCFVWGSHSLGPTFWRTEATL
eukprot:1177167-Prorocentrum_minimum.AAC.9